MTAIDEEVQAKRDQAITWLTSTLSLLVQRDEALAAGNELEAEFFAQAAGAAVMSLNLISSHVAISVALEVLVADFGKKREEVA